MVEVTQADRAAACEYRQLWYDEHRTASEKGFPDLSIAFARHRIAVLEDAAIAAYIACSETRHVSLGDKAAAAIRALKGGWRDG